MGRKVKIRGNYNQDALFMARLQEAIAKDSARPKEWREKTIAALRIAMSCLIEAPVVHEME